MQINKMQNTEYVLLPAYSLQKMVSHIDHFMIEIPSIPSNYCRQIFNLNEALVRAQQPHFQCKFSGWITFKYYATHKHFFSILYGAPRTLCGMCMFVLTRHNKNIYDLIHFKVYNTVPFRTFEMLHSLNNIYSQNIFIIQKEKSYLLAGYSQQSFSSPYIH